MLKKLVKYDLKNIFKILIYFYCLALFFSILTRIFLNVDNSFILNIVGQVCSGVTISMIINILINNLMGLWRRFKNHFYADEAYLTHTLPISKKTLYLSKIVSSLISLLLSTVMIGISLFVAYYSKENMLNLKVLLLPMATAYESTILKIVISFLAVFFLEIATLLQAGYTGIILGHRMNNAKFGFSILYGFSSYMVIQVVVLLIIFIFALFNNNLMDLFVSNQIFDIGVIKLIIFMTCLIYTVVLIITYVLNLKLFEKGVNLD